MSKIICFTQVYTSSAFIRNLENNKLQGALPLSLNRESLEIRYGISIVILLSPVICAFVLLPDAPILCRASGNLCLSFSTLRCNDFSANSSIEIPQVTIFTGKKHTGHNQLAIILGAIGGALLALVIFFSILVFLYMRKKRTEITSAEST